MLESFLADESEAGHRLVAAFVVATQGSTYRKPGAMMLFSSSGKYAGLLSGGCLEADLQAHAMRLLDSGGTASLHDYDSRVSDDPVWGLGLGCEGLMRILLLRLDDDAQPVRTLLESATARKPAACAISLRSGHHAVVLQPAASADAVLVVAATQRLREGGAGLDDAAEIFSLSVEPVPALLLCGAGPDTRPVVEFARTLGWQVTVLDHRPAYLERTRWRPDVELRLADLDAPLVDVATSRFDAAVVMSHHLTADGCYLRALADSSVAYVGLLGPPARRQRLLAEIADGERKLHGRLRAPVGLDLGGRTPEAIALAIVAEIQAVLCGKAGGRFSGV